ncbi:hypothetical protein KUTeg_000343 [Tegillarca granosa]|uniref:Testicular haploid expressed gene protein-like n=1 Tax=Tegillarca granosa TaxID=220873 RepID=A0ABQ9FYD2_TEGGR|nr:hypothetical protein KUTeg_000343 [Tegillarca granosa]
MQVATPRVQELARHRNAVSTYKGDRPTPIWGVKRSALSVEATPRIQELGRHKDAHPEYKMDRSAYTTVGHASRSTQPTPRLESLAQPKVREDRHGVVETQWGQYFPVSNAAKKAQPSERLEQLAESKKYHSHYRGEKPIQWPVSSSALTAMASLRLQQLSRPSSRTLIKDDYDPYKVSLPAKRARATPRLEELCVPLPRKVRQKKVIS